MSTAEEKTQIAVLNTQMSSVQTDVSNIRSDIKEIKNTLLGDFVSQKEFNAFKKSVRVNYLFIMIITAIVSTMAYALLVGKNK